MNREMDNRIFVTTSAKAAPLAVLWVKAQPEITEPLVGPPPLHSNNVSRNLATTSINIAVQRSLTVHLDLPCIVTMLHFPRTPCDSGETTNFY